VIILYVIVVYDVSETRVNKVNHFLKKYLNWVQNSVFEGELTKGGLAEVKVGLKKIIDKNEDSVLFFIASDQKWINKEVLGIEKMDTSNII